MHTNTDCRSLSEIAPVFQDPLTLTYHVRQAEDESLVRITAELISEHTFEAYVFDNPVVAVAFAEGACLLRARDNEYSLSWSPTPAGDGVYLVIIDHSDWVDSARYIDRRTAQSEGPLGSPDGWTYKDAPNAEQHEAILTTLKRLDAVNRLPAHPDVSLVNSIVKTLSDLGYTICRRP